MSRISPDAFLIVIGAQKSGTSSLYNYLIEHPQICRCAVKEPEFFSVNPGNVERYPDLWQFDSSVHKYALEASTGYSSYPYHSGVPEKMNEAGLKPKFIYIVRNPFDRIRSQYHFMKHSIGIEMDQKWLMEEGIKRSDYHLQLSRYRNFFPIENFLILDFDQLVYDSSSAVREIFSFLKLEQSGLPDEIPARNVTLGPTGATIRSINPLRKIFKKLPSPVADRLRKVFVASMKHTPGDLTTEDRNHIYNSLKEAMKQFSDEYDFNTTAWGF